MAIDKWIPRIEWNDQSFTADRTITSPILTIIADTSDLEPGMLVSGSGIPADTRIVSKTSSTVTLTQNATSSGSAQSFTAKHSYSFEFPPVEDSEDVYKPQARVSQSLSGLQQVQTDFIEAVRSLEFWFVLQADADYLRDYLMLGWAQLGKSFRYYQDKADSGVETYTLKSFEFARNRQVKKHPDFKYLLKFSIRRIEL